jgi:hypothetical protein
MPTAMKPGDIVKKNLTVAQAEEQWIKADDRIARDKVLKEEAGAVLAAHLEKKGITRYKRVELVTAKASRVLDQPAVKAFLGKKIDRFMKWTDPSPRGARTVEPKE